MIGYIEKFKGYKEFFDACAKGMHYKEPHYDREADAVATYIPMHRGWEDLYFHEVRKSDGIDPQRAVDRVIEEIRRKNIKLDGKKRVEEIRGHKVIVDWMWGHSVIVNGEKYPLKPSERINKRNERQILIKDLKNLVNELEDEEDGVDIYGLPTDDLEATRECMRSAAQRLIELI